MGFLMKTSLDAEGGAVPLNPFVSRLTGHLLLGVLRSLHLPEEVRQAEFVLNPTGVTIRVSGQDVPLVNNFCKNTVADILRVLLKNLKGTESVAQATFRVSCDD